MKKIKLYTKPDCPYSNKAKKMLKDNGYEYEDVNVLENPGIKEELTAKHGQSTVPYVFVDDQLIGGSSDLEEKMNSGEFHKMMRD